MEKRKKAYTDMIIQTMIIQNKKKKENGSCEKHQK